jgi:hypothetical protein
MLHGTWPSGQGGALASQRSQVRIPAVAVNLTFRFDLLLTAKGALASRRSQVRIPARGQ